MPEGRGHSQQGRLERAFEQSRRKESVILKDSVPQGLFATAFPKPRVERVVHLRALWILILLG